MARVRLFRDLTETEKAKISSRSPKMFTLTGIRSATQALLAGIKIESHEDRVRLAAEFWTEVGRSVPEWQMAGDRRVSPAELRREYIHAHALALAAIARAGNQLLREHPRKWKTVIKKLTTLDWRHGNSALWEGRAMNAGRLSKHCGNVALTANVIKRHLGLPLSPDEDRLEREFATTRRKSSPPASDH